MLWTRQFALLAALLLLAAGLVVNALLGPLFLGVLRYHFSEPMLVQVAGMDAVGAFVAAPTALLAAWLVRRGRVGGPPLAFVPGAFAAYMTPHVVIGPEYGSLGGNNEYFFPFHAALFLLGLAVFVLAWEHIDRLQLLSGGRAVDHRHAWLLGLLAALVLVRWLPLLPEVLTGAVDDPIHAHHPAALLRHFVLVDVAIVVPGTFAAAFGLWTGAVWGRAAAYALIGFYAIAPLSFAAMAVALVVTSSPFASMPVALALFAVATVAVVAAVFAYHSLGIDRPLVVPMSWDARYGSDPDAAR